MSTIQELGGFLTREAGAGAATTPAAAGAAPAPDRAMDGEPAAHR